MLRRLRVKFVIINMAIVTVMLGVILGLICYFTQVRLEQNSIAMMQAIAVSPFQLGAPGDQSQEVQLPYFTLQVGVQGELVAFGGGYFDLSDEELMGELVDAAFSNPSSVGVLEEYNLRFYKADGQSSRILVFADISSERATLRDLARSCAVIGIVSFLAFLVVSILLARWAVRPVASAWKEQKQFVADASHELKTPLTVISANAEIVLNPEYDDDAHRQCAESILSTSVRMRGLVEGMLDLARADQAQEDMLMERLDLSALLNDAVLPYEPVFYERGLQFVTGIQPRVYVRGSAKHLEQVAAILLDNAQKYALPDEPVYCKLWPTGRGRCRLTVSNACTPVSDDQLKAMFKRFYRVEEARSADGSYGLGLSIAERIVSAHRGRIWASCEENTITFSVELPTCK